MKMKKLRRHCQRETITNEELGVKITIIIFILKQNSTILKKNDQLKYFKLMNLIIIFI